MIAVYFAGGSLGKAEDIQTKAHVLNVFTNFTGQKISGAEFEFEGEKYKDWREVEGNPKFWEFSSPETVDIYLPKTVDLKSPKFHLPIQASRLFFRWYQNGVKIRFHLNGKVVPRHTVFFRFVKNTPEMTEAEVIVDGESLGSGEAAWERLKKVDWGSGVVLLDVRFVYEFKPSAGSPSHIVPDGIIDGENIRKTFTSEWIYK